MVTEAGALRKGHVIREGQAAEPPAPGIPARKVPCSEKKETRILSGEDPGFRGDEWKEKRGDYGFS